jgi:uncharacterized protein with ParB-like and HNH nuclease domain
MSLQLSYSNNVSNERKADNTICESNKVIKIFRECREITFQELLNSSQFKIPSYQRSYVWDTEKVNFLEPDTTANRIVWYQNSPLAKEKGLNEADRLIETKISILNKIYATEGVQKMNKFLSHVCRLKMIDEKCEEDFLNSFNITDTDLLKIFTNYTDTLGNCNSMLEYIKKNLQLLRKNISSVN